MKCSLSKFETYRVGQVGHDMTSGAYRVEILNAPASCPDHILMSKAAKLEVKAGIAPSLTFSNTENRPIISVPVKDYVLQYNNPQGLGLGFWLFFGVAFIFAAVYALRKFFLNEEEILRGILSHPLGYSTGTRMAVSQDLPRLGESMNNTHPTHLPSTTFVNNQPSNSGFVTGMLLGELMSQHHHDAPAPVPTYAVLPSEPESSSSDDGDSSYSSDESDSGSYSSDTDSSDSYSSDSSSSDSYSSDSSYDSGSSFGSDSGGGFDGGGSFGD